MPPLRAIFNNCEGSASIEYGLIVSIIAMAVIIALTPVKADLTNFYKGLGYRTVAATPPPPDERRW